MKTIPKNNQPNAMEQIGHVAHTGNKRVRKALRDFAIDHLGGKSMHSDE